MSVLSGEVMEANSVVAVHRRPEGATWIPCCEHCKDGGCPALDDATAHLAEVSRRAFAGGVGTYGRR